MYKRLSRMFYILAALATMFIFSRSMKPAAVSRRESAVFVNFIVSLLHISPVGLTHLVRKTAHFLEFFCQGGCLCAAFILMNKYYERIIYVLFCGLLTAVTDEFLQLFSEGRGSQVSDIFVDFSGTCAAVICGAVIFILIYKRSTRYKNE